MRFRLWLLAICGVLIAGGLTTVKAQDLRWMKVGALQCFFYDYGTEPELTYSSENNNFFLTWPTLYGDEQSTMRQKGLWMGARNFDDPVEKTNKSVKVIGSGPRLPENHYTMIFPQSIEMIAREQPPSVTVDGLTGTSNTLYDTPDDIDETLPCDRMIVMKFNTSMGVSVTKKVLAFTQQNHDDYFIHDLVFKNTGIINAAGDIQEQTLSQFWVYQNWRIALAGVTSTAYGSTWGAFSSQWGSTTLYRTVGSPPDKTQSELRGFYAWYGPHEERTTTYVEDWGCPNILEENGVLGAAKYFGAVTLHADKGPQDSSNDLNQPRTNAYVAADDETMQTSVSQYDETFMGRRWQWMTEGYLTQSQVDEVGDGHYIADIYSTDTDRFGTGGGGSSQGLGFGPYTLAPGDSIRIVFAEAVNGLSWEKCREIGGNWLAYYTGISADPLVNPDGSSATDYNAYKRAWCETGADSIMQTFRNALNNYNSGYAIPQPPPAPSKFIVESGGDRIRLTWEPDAESDPHFNGYVIYRSEGTVKDYRTKYVKVFECDAADVVNTWDDVTAARGKDYYYYIQSKDDGTQNDVEPGKPLYSSPYLTLTSVQAQLVRQAESFMNQVRVVPNPYDIRARLYQFGTTSQYDRIAFYGLPKFCKLKIFTERGDLIWEKDHTNGSGDELWDSMTSSGQIVVSGIYILYVEVSEDIYAEEDNTAWHDMYDEDGNLMYTSGELIYSAGDLIFKKGESIYRKFVIIR